ncbi:MAG: deoxyribonuclease [Solirubrobacteraceae bacterium]|jgi:deoxyribonuclease-4|nr:deoxyribonuclease [Solirubrobacteraceae bacterium]
MLIGAHVSPAGGLAKAVARGLDLECDAIQIFNQSPRMWKPTAYTDEDFAAFREAMDGTRIKRVLIHAVYLINCASEDKELRAKSLTSLAHSLRVGDGIGAGGVVLHAGSALQGDVGKAIKRAGPVIKAALAATESCQLHLENTAGAGGTLGRSFTELAGLLDAAGGDERIGFCLDSCHLLASGYDVRTPDAIRATLDAFDEAAGAQRLRSLHVNDSVTPLGSNRDRHAPIGAGEIGRAGCAAFLSEPAFDGLPAILEGPGMKGKGIDVADIRLMKRLRKQGAKKR